MVMVPAAGATLERAIMVPGCVQPAISSLETLHLVMKSGTSTVEGEGDHESVTDDIVVISTAGLNQKGKGCVFVA